MMSQASKRTGYPPSPLPELRLSQSSVESSQDSESLSASEGPASRSSSSAATHSKLAASAAQVPDFTRFCQGLLAERRRREKDEEEKGDRLETVDDTEKNTTGAVALAETANEIGFRASTLPSQEEALKSTTIHVLSPAVVDKISAGEVVQRPASVVKELLENCLDAGSTHIVVHIEKGGLAKISVADNGCGIAFDDLRLAATRHATSKFAEVNDFDALDTFGFRGEALSSISVASRRVTITTRTRDMPLAYTQMYEEGKVLGNKPPKRIAKNPGTTVVVLDLFHNVPNRRKMYSRRENDEYSKILKVVQAYAMHYSHVGFVCQRTRGTGKSATTELVDLNTSSLPCVKKLVQIQERKRRQAGCALGAGGKQAKSAQMSSLNGEIDSESIIKATKQAIAHVYGSKLCSSMRHFDLKKAATTADPFAFECRLFYSSPSEKATERTELVLLLNDRLVDCHEIKRALEDAYAQGSIYRPLMVAKISVPCNQVDINVHPSKRQVALVYLDELCGAVSAKLRECLGADGQSFRDNSISSSLVTPAKTQQKLVNPYSSDRKRKREEGASVDDAPALKKAAKTSSGDDEDHKSSSPTGGLGTPIKPVSPEIKNPYLTPLKRTSPAFIRTHKATPVGAIEPFLVRKRSPSATKADDSDSPARGTVLHTADCPRAAADSGAVDMTEPGAFASALKCTCPQDGTGVRVPKPVVRLKPVVPTTCNLRSIISLRSRVNKEKNPDLEKQLRHAYFVGIMSQHRSIIQCGEQMVLINHVGLGKELFYQLGLARFDGGAKTASLGRSGINIQAVIAQALEMESRLSAPDAPNDDGESLRGLLPVSSVNQELAHQATMCLIAGRRAEMLKDYFGICIDVCDGTAFLTGLPVLLDGHAPPPHGLPIFLLRLATKVDWDSEMQCLKGVCCELALYYATMPSGKEALEAHVRHLLFPAISYMLLPSERCISSGNWSTMTTLQTLYRVFERC